MAQGSPHRQNERAILANFVDCGILNNVCAHGAALVADAIMKTNLDGLKPYKTFPDGVDHEIAMQLILEYLNRHELFETLRTVKIETLDQFPSDRSPVLENELGLSGVEGACTDLTNDWISAGQAIRHANDEQKVGQIREAIGNVRVHVAHKHPHHDSHARSLTVMPPPEPPAKASAHSHHHERRTRSRGDVRSPDRNLDKQ
jgi:hypothetical protein